MSDQQCVIIYIQSFSHGGSTVLDFIASHLKGSIGLGEVYSVLWKKKTNLENTQDICGCGRAMSECPFWNDLYSRPVLSYNDICKKAHSLGHKYIIDSSKKTKLLRELHNSYKVFPILLIRDPRGWARSQQRIGEKMGVRTMPFWYQEIKWLFFILFFGLRIAILDSKVLILSYEEVLKRPEEVLRKLQNFVGAENIESNPISHIAYGNRTKFTLGSLKDIKESEGAFPFISTFWYYCIFPIALCHQIIKRLHGRVL